MCTLQNLVCIRFWKARPWGWLIGRINDIIKELNLTPSALFLTLAGPQQLQPYHFPTDLKKIVENNHHWVQESIMAGITHLSHHANPLIGTHQELTKASNLGNQLHPPLTSSLKPPPIFGNFVYTLPRWISPQIPPPQKLVFTSPLSFPTSQPLFLSTQQSSSTTPFHLLFEFPERYKRPRLYTHPPIHLEDCIHYAVLSTGCRPFGREA